MVAREVTIGDVNGNPVTFLAALLTKSEVVAYMADKDIKNYFIDLHAPRFWYYTYDANKLDDDGMYLIYKLENSDGGFNNGYVIAEYVE